MKPSFGGFFLFQPPNKQIKVHEHNLRYWHTIKCEWWVFWGGKSLTYELVDFFMTFSKYFSFFEHAEAKMTSHYHVVNHQAWWQHAALRVYHPPWWWNMNGNDGALRRSCKIYFNYLGISLSPQVFVLVGFQVMNICWKGVNLQGNREKSKKKTAPPKLTCFPLKI